MTGGPDTGQDMKQQQQQVRNEWAKQAALSRKTWYKYIKEWEGGMVLCVHRSCRSHMQGEGNGVGMVEAIN